LTYLSAMLGFKGGHFFFRKRHVNIVPSCNVLLEGREPFSHLAGAVPHHYVNTIF